MSDLLRRAYDAPGWGTGEVWTRGRVVLLHVLAGTDAALADAAAAASSRAVSTLQGLAPAPRNLATTSATTSPRGAGRPPASTVDRDLRRQDHGFVADLCRRVVAHLDGERVDYDDVELDLDGCTELERALTQALRGVGWGEVVSYGELAALAGRPGAARAAGSFCARSDVALVVPCHRVVAAQGIGGYGDAGVGVKRRLLALEGVSL